MNHSTKSSTYLSALDKLPFHLLLLPFLFLYVGLIVLLNKAGLHGDEGRYLTYAENLLQGFYSPKGEVFLWNGPGYPLFLTPFVALGCPNLCLRLLNAVLHYGSLCLVFKTLRLYLPKKQSYLATFLLGIYWMPFKEMPSILSDVFTFFLLALLTYLLCAYLQRPIHNTKTDATTPTKKYLFWALTFTLAYLMLTKVIFAYVVVVSMLLLLGVWLWKRQKVYQSLLGICLWAFLVCSPYLGYTYQLTGKFFYWSNAGGMSLYWMSTPYVDEYGDWQNETLTTSKGVAGATEKFQANHQATYDRILALEGVERDAAFKAVAIENIRQHPTKFIQNWFCNIGRMLFNYPYSYYPQTLSTYGNIVPNMFVLVFSLLFALPTLLYFRRIPLEIRLLLLFALIYLGGSSLLSTYPRQFYVVMPILVVWLGVVMDKVITIKV